MKESSDCNIDLDNPVISDDNISDICDDPTPPPRKRRRLSYNQTGRTYSMRLRSKSNNVSNSNGMNASNF